jgi:hypothetical protein
VVVAPAVVGVSPGSQEVSVPSRGSVVAPVGGSDSAPPVVEESVAVPESAVVAPAAVSAPAAAPVITAPRAAAAAGGVRGVGSDVLAWLAFGGSGDSPAAAPLVWAAAAAARREIGGVSRTAAPAAVVSSGEPVSPLIGSAVASPGAAAPWRPGRILRLFVGNGTAANTSAQLV